MLTVGSLFAGIGGFDLGFERAGMRSLWQSELDPFCQRVLAKHWPDVLRVPDVRDVGRDTVPYVDVICGGFPCQDISLAGKGAGLSGARSGLWSEYARIVGELRPRYVVVENVAALIARGLPAVLADLSNLGYDAEWGVVSAADVGAPHLRKRLWIVAYPNGEQLRVEPGRGSGPHGEEAPLAPVDGEARPVADPDGERREGRTGQLGPRWRDEPADGSEDLADADQERRAEGLRDAARPDERPGTGDALGIGQHVGPEEWWAAEPDVGRVAYGVPSRMDRTSALGNALVPQIAEWIGRRIVAYEAEGAMTNAA